MKKVVNRGQVPHMWFHQSQPYARAKSTALSYDGTVIYSYGTIMGYINYKDGKKYVFLNKGSYSRTTADHQTDISRAIDRSECTVIHYYYSSEREYIEKAVIEAFKDLTNPSNKVYKDRWTKFNSELENWKKYCEFLDIDPIIGDLEKHKQTEYVFNLLSRMDQLILEEDRKKAEARRKKAIVEEMLMEDRIREFRNFCRRSINANVAYLRYNSVENNIETSLGMSISKDVFLRYYDQWKKKELTQVLSYTTNVFEDAVKVGCHYMLNEEIENIYLQINEL